MTDEQRESARSRALVLSQAIKRKDDIHICALIERFTDNLDYQAEGLETLGISDTAWSYVQQLGVEPKKVFAHPELLRQYPEASLYYRGMTTLSIKRVKNIAANVDSWEGPQRYLRKEPAPEALSRVSRLYNEMISSIIEGTETWTLEDGHRNILATIAITLDGKIRNRIGKEAENAIREKLLDWIDSMKIPVEVNEPYFVLGKDQAIRMRFGSEPDILFEKYNAQERDWIAEVTIEIKGGTDPAGALERLGAIKKSFDQTPARTRNFAVLGVVTPAMRKELDKMSIKDFNLYELLHTESGWDGFMEELFFHELRLIPLIQ